MKQHYLLHRYTKSFDFSGKDLLSLSGATREDLRRVIPDLVAPEKMSSRKAALDVLTAYNSEIADEVHEFSNAIQGGFKLKKILLKQGVVIEVMIGW